VRELTCVNHKKIPLSSK